MKTELGNVPDLFDQLEIFLSEWRPCAPDKYREKRKRQPKHRNNKLALRPFTGVMKRKQLRRGNADSESVERECRQEPARGAEGGASADSSAPSSETWKPVEDAVEDFPPALKKCYRDYGLATVVAVRLSIAEPLCAPALDG